MRKIEERERADGLCSYAVRFRHGPGLEDPSKPRQITSVCSPASRPAPAHASPGCGTAPGRHTSATCRPTASPATRSPPRSTTSPTAIPPRTSRTNAACAPACSPGASSGATCRADPAAGGRPAAPGEKVEMRIITSEEWPRDGGDRALPLARLLHLLRHRVPVRRGDRPPGAGRRVARRPDRPCRHAPVACASSAPPRRRGATAPSSCPTASAPEPT